MPVKSIWFFVLLFTFLPMKQYAQGEKEKLGHLNGTFSLGMRSTLSLFDGDGAGLGSGGQFRIQLSDKVNTDWYADFININVGNRVRSTYYHIGWSVLFYPFSHQQFPKLIQPYVLAGHCFDYNQKTSLSDPNNSKSRWGSAVQAGIGTHFNLSSRFDISLTSQYMIHLTKELETDLTGNEVVISEAENSTLEGHLLTTISINYKICHLWK